MKKQKKSIGNVIVMVAFCFMVFVVAFGGIGNSKAAGGDYEDKAWSFNLSVNDTSYKFTQHYRKYTNSAIYFNWQMSYGTLSAIEVSPYAYDGSYKAAGEFDKSTNTNSFKSYKVSNTGQYMVTNYVFEMDEENEACLALRGVTGGGTAFGQMSPDCLGSYPRLY
ncbi:MAG: hypothetical protein J6A25_11985 [Lachnospiraceae bacterium]|nr:hypothetical protein [Lachnospiraceae bacterium]